MAQPVAQAESTDRPTRRRRSRHSRPTSPRSAPGRDPRRDRLQHSRVSATRSANRRSSAWPDLPDHCTACHNSRAPRCDAPRWLRPEDPRRRPEVHLRGDADRSTGRWTISNGNLSPEEKRDVIAYLQSLEDPPAYGGFGLGGMGPVSEGALRLAGRHRHLRQLRRLDRRPHHPHPRRGRSNREGVRRLAPGPAERATSRFPTRACRPTSTGRPTSTPCWRSRPSGRSPLSSA